MQAENGTDIIVLSLPVLINAVYQFCAEAICETIDGNTKELVEVNGGVRKMVGQVNKASSARDKYFEMSNGNGIGGNGKRETQFFPTPDIPSTNPR